MIAGDISHYNKLSILFLKKVSNFYELVLFCLGNHDYYLISNNQLKTYKTSLNRVLEMRKQIAENVHFVDGETVFEHNGIKFGGNTWGMTCKNSLRLLFF